MIKSIKKLIEEVYMEKIQKEQLRASQKEAEFKMLANQINPHFLYNTLETIRMKAFCNGDKEIADIVKKLGKIMRRNLEVSGKMVSLKSELDLIDSYLQIQAMRFEGMVKYELNIESSIKKEEYENCRYKGLCILRRHNYADEGIDSPVSKPFRNLVEQILAIGWIGEDNPDIHCIGLLARTDVGD